MSLVLKIETKVEEKKIHNVKPDFKSCEVGEHQVVLIFENYFPFPSFSLTLSLERKIEYTF